MATDFALTPTGDAVVAASFGPLLKLRPNTTLLGPSQGARSIRSFLRAVDLETDPIGNLIFTSHATPSGAISLRLIDGNDQSSDLNFDTLTAALAANPLVARASGGLITRLVPNAGIIVKGCDLGRSPEFMKLLQTAIGSTFGVIASLYAHCAGEDPANGGWIEFMMYDLRQDYFLSQDDKFDTVDADKVKALTRNQLIADMKANPRNRQLDGSSFSDAAWDKMIPKKMPALNAGKLPKPFRDPFTARLPAAWHLKPFPLREMEGNKFLDIARFAVANDPMVTWDVPGDPGPGNDSPLAARRAFIQSKLATDPRHQATHPYPVYKRYGFANLQDYVDHFDWGKFDDTTWIAKTWRFTKAIPIIDPTTGELICNRYTSTGKQEALLETNPLLFAAVAAAP